MALAASGARAEVPPFYQLGTRPDADILALGILYFHSPLYAGSEQMRTIVVPSGTAILTNGFFADPISGIGYNASTDTRFEYGPRVTLGLGREDTAAVHGLGMIHNVLNVGGFANYNATERLQFQSTLRYGSGYNQDGMLVDIGASYDIFQEGHVAVTVDTTLSYANAAYMQSFYGVTPAQSAASGYTPYSPRAGVQWYTGELSITAPVHPKALAYFSVEYTRLSGPAADSPIAKKSGFVTIEANVSYGF